METIFCKCGCGLERPKFDSKGNERFFIAGHVARGNQYCKGRFKGEEKVQEVIECACGCGEKLLKYNKRWHERKYAGVGHQARGNTWRKGAVYPGLAERNRARRGEKRSPEFIEGRRKQMLGKQYTLGKKLPRKTDEERLTPLQKTIRRMTESQIWRKAVFERDDYQCQKCGNRGGRLEANHIKPFIIILVQYSIDSTEAARNCTELWDIENGETLCHDCHIKTPTWGSKITRETELFKTMLALWT